MFICGLMAGGGGMVTVSRLCSVSGASSITGEVEYCPEKRAAFPRVGDSLFKGSLAFG